MSTYNSNRGEKKIARERSTSCRSDFGAPSLCSPHINAPSLRHVSSLLISSQHCAPVDDSTAFPLCSSSPLSALLPPHLSPSRIMSSNLVTARRVVRYLRHNGLLRGGRQLFRIFRQLHELRLGEFKGRDWRGNEFYFDRQASWYKRRFVIYKDRQSTPLCRRCGEE
jgi:hypothetical protein